MDFEENSPQNPENDIIVGQICYDELDLKPIEEPKHGNRRENGTM